MQAVSRLSAVRSSGGTPLISGAVIEALEGVTALGFGLYIGIEALVGKPHDMASALAVAALLLGAGAAMLAVARGLLRRMSWARSPAVLTQLFAIFIAYNLYQSKQTIFAAVLAACAVVALIMLFVPGTTRALTQDDEAEDQG